MLISRPQECIDHIKAFNIDTKYCVVKPNWVSNQAGEYTEPEILDLLLKALPKQKKIIVESYTPWRGLKFVGDDNHKGEGVSLEGGKIHEAFYKKQDEYFLETTGIGAVLKKYKADYINITNEVWIGNCLRADVIKKLVESKGKTIRWRELYSYIPQRIYDIKDSSTFISLSKIKVEESIPVIYISMSIKNLFGLIPHPSRWIPFHGDVHTLVPEVIRDIYNIYTSLFDKTLWIAEGIKTFVKDYCGPSQKIVENQNLMFIGKDARKVDSEGCKAVGVDPKKVPHLELIS